MKTTPNFCITYLAVTYRQLERSCKEDTNKIVKNILLIEHDDFIIYERQDT